MFVIEHMEPEVYDWCMLEYRHINSIMAGRVIFTNMEPVDGLDCRKEHYYELGRDYCILDPNAEKTLSSQDRHDFYVFGGILGDEDARGRTQRLIGFTRRNLGSMQLATDNAVFVARHLLQGGSLEGLEFADDVEIEIEEGESMILPFRYVVVGGKPLVAPGLAEHLKKGFL